MRNFIEDTPPTPTLVLDMMVAYQRTAALAAAVELDLFTAIGEGAATADVLAARCRASPRGVRILCDYLAAAGLLRKDGERYEPTRDSAAFLDRRSASYLGGAKDFLVAPSMVEAFLRDPAGPVRRGGTVVPDHGTLAPENPVWVTFARAMAPMMTMPAERLADRLALDAAPRLRILDIAAGHGLFGVALARRNPRAEIVAVDWPNVLAVAQETAAAAGLADRFAAKPGSAFEVEFGDGYDVVLLANFLHHFDAATCEGLLKKCRTALAPGGCVVALEFVPDENRVTPPGPAMFSFVMLVTTPSGDAYTRAQLERMFANAGFTRTEFDRLPPSEEAVAIGYV